MTQFWPKPRGKKLWMLLPRLPIEHSVEQPFSPFRGGGREGRCGRGVT